jgi:PAS domain S-box-containing protein
MEDSFSGVLNALPGLVWTAVPDGPIDFVNQRFCEYTGLSIEEAAGWGWQTAIHPEDLPKLVERWPSILTSGGPGEMEARLRRFDGEYHWFIISCNPMRDETGQVVKWFGFNTDIEDRRQGETLLRESEQRFKAIFDEAGVGIALVDLKGRAPIRNNRALQKMLGCSEDELSRDETFDQLTCEANREADGIVFHEICAGLHDTLRMEKHFILRDDRSVWANVIFTLLRDDEGYPRYLIAIHEDITERKRALEKLQANQDLLDLAQKAARAMAFDWYIQEPANTWSPEQEALYGLAPGTFDGRYESWKKLVHPNDWPLIVKALKRAQETGDITVEYRVVWPDGHTHWLAANGQMFFDDEGQPYRMVGFTADVTPRKLVEEELHRSAAFLSEAQRLSSIGSFSWLVGTDEFVWSEELYRIFEFDRDKPVTLGLLGTRVHPEDKPLINEHVARARVDGSDVEFDFRLQVPDASVKYMHVVAHSGRNENGQMEYIGAVQDVTERRRSEEALGEVRSELAHMTRVMSLGTLTASIAHEVNQPLSGIITNASTCLRMLDADPPNVDGARQTAQRTIRDGHRASDVITRLRALFTKKGAATESVDLNEATREVMALSRSELQRSQVLSRLELAHDLPPVTGDRVQLQQVILNLLLNASDAMSGVDDRPRQLVIRTDRDEGNHVRLSVQDVGGGFGPQGPAKLFEPFYTTKNGGMGIGLAVSRSIIESHHGRLWATANDGPGATFSFSIPRSLRGV